MYIPIEFKSLRPKLSKYEVKLVTENGYTVDMIKDRRKKDKERLKEQARIMREARLPDSEMGPPRAVKNVPKEELLVIEDEYIEKDIGQEVTVKYLAQKHRIYPAELEKFASARKWTSKQDAYQKKLQIARGARNTPNEIADEAGTEIITQMQKDEETALTEFEQMNRGQKSSQRSLQLMRLRMKAAKALRITEQDYIIYKNNPRMIIREIDNMIADPVQTKNFATLVQSFKTIVELEREEDGWIKGRGASGGLEQETEEEEILEVTGFKFPEKDQPKGIEGVIIPDEEEVFSE